MGVCIKLAIRSLQKNKGRTLVTLLGIVLSVLLVCTVLTLLNSMLCSTVDSIIEKNGNWHIAVYTTMEQESVDYESIDGVASVETISRKGNTISRIVLENPSDVYSFVSNYLEGKVDYSYNTELLSYLGVSQSENIKNLIIGIAVALLAIIAIGAVSLIYNAFAISVSERTKEIGLLSSIGATKKDIRTIIYSEALLLGTAAIPLGVGLGILTSWAMLDLFGSYLEKILYVDIGMKLYPNVWLLLITVVITYLLVLISAGVPARSASQISIIDNLKGAKGSFKIKRSKDKERVESLLAKRNMKREKKSFRAVAFSLAISIFLFVSANAFSVYMLSFIEAEKEKIGYDLRMRYSLELGEKGFDGLFDFISSQDGIDELGWFAENTKAHSVLLHSSWVTDSYIDSPSATFKENTEFYKRPLFVFIISDERYAEFLLQNGLENDNTIYASAFCEEIDTEGATIEYPILENGKYQVDIRYMSEEASEQLSQDIRDNPDGTFDNEDYYDTFYSIQITVGNYDFPLEFRANSDGVNILLPESRMSECYANIVSKEIMIQSPNYNNIQANIVDYLTSKGLTDDINIFNASESYESQRNLAAMIKLFSSSFLILLTVISCANVFNVMTTSLNMRKRDFAVLRSVGMTIGQLFKILCIENLCNGIISVVIGGVASLPLCYLLYKSIVIGAVIDFTFPIEAYIFASLAMIAIMFLTSVYGLFKIKKENVINDVRNDFV